MGLFSGYQVGTLTAHQLKKYGSSCDQVSEMSLIF
jgi:hypothetical protein